MNVSTIFLLPVLLLPAVHGFCRIINNPSPPHCQQHQCRHQHIVISQSSSSSLLKSSSSSYNPNDEETPEERKARMELVRQIQANYYNNDDDDDKDSSSSSNSNSTNDDRDGEGGAQPEQRWLRRDASDPTILRNVPLWRVQWTELPGYQNVLNVHVAHYTHMFRRLVMQHPPPWYFGHVYLHEGSENLGNPDYFLPHYHRDDDANDGNNENNRNDDDTALIANDEWYAPTVGTLMQITDYATLEDGRLVLIVQGVGRMKILDATQHVPYAVGNVQLLPDEELWKPNFDVLTSSFDPEADEDLIEAVGAASRAVACRQEERLRELEYRATVLDLTSGGTLEVSPLSNIDRDASLDFQGLQTDLANVFRQRLSDVANKLESGDEILFAASSLQWPSTTDTEDGASTEKVMAEWEQKVWIELDRMIQLLETIQPGLKIPVPAQMLGLMPTNVEWPATFRMEGYAEKLEREGAVVGTHSKSPFVRLSKRYPGYPMLRRASRFSYVVWMLLNTVSFDNQTLNKEEVLQILSIRDRLERAHAQLQSLNGALLSMYEE